MRCSRLTAVAFGAAALMGAAPASAQTRDYPFCIKGGNYVSSLGDCSFDTYEQCVATASGRYSFCDRNPYYVGDSRPNVAKRKKRAGQQ